MYFQDDFQVNWTEYFDIVDADAPKRVKSTEHRIFLKIQSEPSHLGYLPGIETTLPDRKGSNGMKIGTEIKKLRWMSS